MAKVDRVRAAHGVCNVLDHEIFRQESVVADSRADGELQWQIKVSCVCTSIPSPDPPFPCRIDVLS